MVTFSQVGGLTAQETVTATDGTAVLTFLHPKLGSLTVNAKFIGSSRLAASRGTAKRTVSRSATTLTVTLPKVLPNGRLFTASARLLRAGGGSVARQWVTFAQTGAGKVAPRKVQTDAKGRARITVAAPWYGRMTVSASYAGSSTVAPSKGTASRVLVDPEHC